MLNHTKFTFQYFELKQLGKSALNFAAYYIPKYQITLTNHEYKYNSYPIKLLPSYSNLSQTNFLFLS